MEKSNVKSHSTIFNLLTGGALASENYSNEFSNFDDDNEDDLRELTLERKQRKKGVTVERLNEIDEAGSGKSLVICVIILTHVLDF